MVMRTCGTCTKCCEGYITATIRGQEVSPGKPCFLLQIGKGCVDYDNRPDDPCKMFECEWLANMQVPDWLYPDKSGVIIHNQKIERIPYLRMTPTTNLPSRSALVWFLAHGIKNNINICWVDAEGEHWSGDTIFEEAMERRKDNV
jgi:hypothetical protein